MLANYLRENAVIPEKCDLNDILFIITPAETKAKINNLISRILHFDNGTLEEDLLLSEQNEKKIHTIFGLKEEENYA